jgi:cell wall assembly regulator SMI1
MQNHLLDKWKLINDWFIINHSQVFSSDRYKNVAFSANNFAAPAHPNEIIQIEDIVSEKIPDEIKIILKKHNGEIGLGNSPFFEQRLIDAKEIKEQIEFGLSLTKPANRYIENPDASNQLIRQIIDEIKSKIDSSDWFKLKFEGSPTSFGHPTLYRNKFDSIDKENIQIEHKPALDLIKDLHKLEKETYDWDDIKFTVFQDGKIEVERTDTDWNYSITGFPNQTVKAIYFHYKWIPLFSDQGGNYIGIDLDPDVNGVKGQIIIYGRDVYQNIKVADSLENFFDKILNDIKKGADSIILKDKKYHIHERLKLL